MPPVRIIGWLAWLAWLVVVYLDCCLPPLFSFLCTYYIARPVLHTLPPLTHEAAGSQVSAESSDPNSILPSVGRTDLEFTAQWSFIYVLLWLLRRASPTQCSCWVYNARPLVPRARMAARSPSSTARVVTVVPNVHQVIITLSVRPLKVARK